MAFATWLWVSELSRNGCQNWLAALPINAFRTHIMVTLLTTPKPFRGHIKTIQENALRSWSVLYPKPQILLFGDEEGSAEICNEVGAQHVPDVPRNSFGTPLLSAIFGMARELAKHEILCYVNADIILTKSFLNAVTILRQRSDRLAMFCSPWTLYLEYALDFTAPDWEEQLQHLIHEKGTPPAHRGVDVFLFSPGLFKSIPPFAIGRIAWDNWLIYEACRNAALSVDGSIYAGVVHQNHAGSTHTNSPSVREEFRHNRKLAGWWATSFVAEDLPYELQRDGHLRKKGFPERLRQRLKEVTSPAVWRLLDSTYTLRRTLGLYRKSL
jgi:hypothetical protein